MTSQIYWHYAFPLIFKGHYFIKHLKYILLEMLLYLELYCIINDKVCPNTRESYISNSKILFIIHGNAPYTILTLKSRMYFVFEVKYEDDFL